MSPTAPEPQEQASRDRVVALAATTVFDTLDDPVSIFTLDGVYVYVNERGQALLGRPARELLGRSYLDAYPDLRAHPFHAAFERVARGVSPLERLEFFYEPMGLWSEQRLHRPDDRHVVVLWRNVTERKDAERATALLLADLAAHKLLLESSLAYAAAIASLATSLSTARTPSEVASVATEEGARACGADMCTLYMVTDEGGDLELIGERGVAPGLLEQIRRIPSAVGASAAWAEGDDDYEPLVPAVAASSERQARAYWSLPLVAEGHRIGLLGMGFFAPRRFSAGDRAFADTFVKQCAQALLRAARLEREMVARRLETRDRIRSEFIAAAAKELSSASLDYRATLAAVARLAVPKLADWCAVELLEPGDEAARQVAVAHVDPAKLELARVLREKYPPDPHATTGAPEVIRTGRSELYAEIPAGMLESAAVDAEHLCLIRELDLASAMVVPLRGRVDTFGAITFVYSGQGRSYSQDDLAFAEDFAHRAALAIENARALKQVEDAKRLLDTVLDRMPSGLVVVDATGARTLANRRAAEILGPAPAPSTAEHVEADWSFSTRGRPLGRDQWPLERSRLRGEEVRHEEIDLRRPDGVELCVSVNASPLRDREGGTIGAVAVFDDISAQKRLEAERAQHESFRELFIGILGHDLRNPLSAITTGAHLLAMRGALTPEDTRVVQRILSSSARMVRMIEQILDFTRARLAGGIPVVRATVDARAVMSSVVAEAAAGREGAKVDVEVSGRTAGHWDADRLAQVFSNLVSNALEHGAGAPIKVALVEDGDALRVGVHNEGEPIPSHVLPLLFDPFRQGEKRGPRSRGLGLGLYITRQIALAHGGAVEARSSAAEGTTFELRLPYESARGADESG